jgi:uncharacterized protein (DUF1015 family)
MDEVELTVKPLAEVTDERGVKHTVWRCPDVAEIVRLFTQVSRSYIADGHHRAAAAARLANEKPGPLGILTVYFPASELRVLPYHRLVLKLDPFTPATFLEEAKKVFQVTPSPTAPPDETGKIGLFMEGNGISSRGKPTRNRIQLPSWTPPLFRIACSGLSYR